MQDKIASQCYDHELCVSTIKSTRYSNFIHKKKLIPAHPTIINSNNSNSQFTNKISKVYHPPSNLMVNYQNIYQQQSHPIKVFKIKAHKLQEEHTLRWSTLEHKNNLVEYKEFNWMMWIWSVGVWIIWRNIIEREWRKWMLGLERKRMKEGRKKHTFYENCNTPSFRALILEYKKNFGRKDDWN